MTFKTFGVIGGGAWGTALAQTLSASGLETRLWCREAETVKSINNSHVNDIFLPGVPLHDALKATDNFADIVGADALLLVSPAQHVRTVIEMFRDGFRPDTPVIICAKGIEQATGKLMVEVVQEELPLARLAILSGPSFASDVARGLPTAVTLASLDKVLGEELAQTIGNKTFRIYWSNDMTGVELGGALKNVLAIAAGIVEGKALGASAHAALVTRGFAELRRFAEAYGAQTETLMGLSGLGDLILTCGSKTSRNMSLGVALGEGRSLPEVLGERSSVTEGVYTATAVCKLAKQRGIEMPITEAVAAILSGDVPVDAAIEALMHRPQKAED
jgi:glycerol-3-phosphate dehydrogenase (NAD(P)+)